MAYHVYILTNFRKTVLYVGFSGELSQRIEQHKSYQIEGFTKKYKVNTLVYFESFEDVNEARARERAIKKWNRAWKDELISHSNPEWKELVAII